MKNLKRILISSMLVGSFIACDNDDDTPVVVVEEEVITTMTITLTPNGVGTPIIMQTRDADGDGPNAPVVSVSGNLTANTAYNGSIELLNELATPAEDITEEVEEKDDEHQFFFQATNSVATFTYNDMDGDGNPIGLSFTLTTSAAGTGTVTVSLIHEPMKNASGVSNGDITNAGGEEDIAETFNVVVQ
ncbi:type 1 periplasmic binding fold superfamily protein [uncultured Algibacter sp.]|uniref:type 1 periplasmic binding fold superfamily protein n=1 Tax=uncultured Algibacter sp. TaxID=298659 RepID=UPI002635B1B2|nr:type 1 periplasmic binding fold superfamily protein [uncultured Algibacter sp.]